MEAFSIFEKGDSVNVYIDRDVLNSLNAFLDDYPGMSTAPFSGAGVCLCGKFRFKADVSGSEEIEDYYKKGLEQIERIEMLLDQVRDFLRPGIGNRTDRHVRDRTLRSRLSPACSPRIPIPPPPPRA